MIVNKCLTLLSMVLINLRGLTLGKNLIGFRIVGGHEIDITEATYQVSVIKQGTHTCGGTIIDRDIIITAAHCVDRFRAKYFHIRAGSSFSFKGGQIIPVSDFIRHPNFSISTMDNDVAILWLQWPLTDKNGVRSVMMMEDGEEIPDGDIAVVTGWGLTRENGSISPTLQRVKVRKMSEQECRAAYPTNTINSRMLCAGYPKGGKDACQGDSGGPMIYNGKLAGVVSWGKGCARAGYPGVYAKVSALREWLDYNISLLKQKYCTYDYYYNWN